MQYYMKSVLLSKTLSQTVSVRYSSGYAPAKTFIFPCNKPWVTYNLDGWTGFILFFLDDPIV